MAADDSLLFIDANCHLDLYRKRADKRILDNLVEIAPSVFSTHQIMDEVRRWNKQVALEAMERAFQRIANTDIEEELPNHLLSDDAALELSAFLDIRADFTKVLKVIKNELREKIHRREDKVSSTLAQIFGNSEPHSREQLERARERRDRGNPPGNRLTIGDQLNWEQLLDRFRGKARLWIVSRDRDYERCAKLERKKKRREQTERRELNQFLHDELHKINKSVEVYLFDNLAKGIDDFKKRSR